MNKPTLVGFSYLPADTFADGSPSGANDGTGKPISSNGRTGPFPGQPVQGFSGVQFADSDSYWFLSDNGFGSQTNSADYLLRIHKVDPDFKTVDNGNGNAESTEFIQLSDPNNLIGWQIVNETSPDRQLTGADFDPESIVLAEDGTIWVGEEFGPYLLHFDRNGVLIDPPIATPNIYPLDTLGGQDPIVIGHRGGTPGIRPEHTIGDLGGDLIASNNLGAEFGADFLEPDLVVTKDGVLIVRHEPVLASVETDENGNIIYDENGKPVIKEATTNVANFEKFGDRLTTKVVDGESITGWFAEDFTLAEIKELRAVERLPEIRPESTNYDGFFQIPTLAEYINFVKEYEAETGKKLGIYPETKHPTYFTETGKYLDGTPINIDTSQLLIDTLVANEFTDPDRVFIQSFEVSNLKQLKNEIMPAAGVDIPLVQLIDSSGAPYDYVYNGIDQTYADLIAPEGLTEIATYAEGIGPSKRLIVPAATVDNNGDGQADDINGDGEISDADRFAGEPTSLVDDAHAAGLLVHPYTFRSDDYYLLADYKGNPELEYEQFIRLGVDGYFTDFVDDGVAAKDKVTADEVSSPQNSAVKQDKAIDNLARSRGFEAMSYSPDRQTLYPILEGYVTGDPTDSRRVYKFDVASKSFSHDLAGYYQVDNSDHAIGDATPINDTEFLIIERDEKFGAEAEFKKVFKIDVTKTNEQGYLQKEEVIDLLNIADPNDLNGDGSDVFTFPFLTIEDILVVDENTILLANDNNYPFNAIRNLSEPDNNELIKVELSTPLNLDPRLGTPKSEAEPPSDTPTFTQQDLYFGRDIPGGAEVSDAEFQAFVDEVIAPLVPGLTLFDARGQVKDADGDINKEKSNVVTLILENTSENATIVNQVLAAYNERFKGAGTLQVTNSDDLKVSFELTDDLIDNDPTPEFVQADLYFGRNISTGGQVSEQEFSQFLDKSITPRFTGLTVFNAEGRFLDDTSSVVEEPSKVVTLLFEDTQNNEDALQEVVQAYIDEFQQQSVLQVVNEDIEVSFGPAEDVIDNDPTPELIQADLYFGRNIPNARQVSEQDFQRFLDEFVSPRFAGLTTFDAQGQVRDEDGSILKEPSKVVTLILEDTQTNEDAINEVLTAYQEKFNGAGVVQVIDEEITALTPKTIFGTPGNDELYADIGRGENIVTGGEGADQFWIVSNETNLPAKPNTITDFNSAEGDVIGLDGTSFTFESLGSDWTTRQEGNDAVIQVFGQDVAVLLGIQANSLTQANFVFA
jgi:hypothetical protein